MDFINIDIDKISLVKSIKSSYDFKYQDTNGIEFYSPELLVPFGLDKKYNDYFLNLQLLNYKTSKDVMMFYNFIVNLEKRIIDLLNITENQLNSQIRINNNYDPILYTKINTKYNKLICDYKSYSNENLNIYELSKNTNVKVKLVLDKIWEKDNKYFYKIKTKEIIE